MCTSSRRYALDIFTDNGESLGQVAIEPDWVPALECVTFDGVRQGRLRALMTASTGTIEPVWDAIRGEPHVSGFRAVIPADDGGSISADFPTTYFSSLARRASVGFVEKGLLKSGELFRYLVCAFPAREAEPTSAGLAVEEIPERLPLVEASLQQFVNLSVQAGDSAVVGDFPVFVSQHVLDEVVEAARQAKDVEVGGVLVGKMHRDSGSGDIFVQITAQIPAEHALSHAAKLTFTAETWAAVDAAIRLRRLDEVKLGWWHYHPDFCRKCPAEKRRTCGFSSAFFSSDDVHVQRVCFSRAYNVALLISDNTENGLSQSLFGWRQGMVQARGFHNLKEEPGTGRGVPGLQVQENTLRPSPGAVLRETGNEF